MFLQVLQGKLLPELVCLISDYAFVCLPERFESNIMRIAKPIDFYCNDESVVIFTTFSSVQWALLHFECHIDLQFNNKLVPITMTFYLGQKKLSSFYFIHETPTAFVHHFQEMVFFAQEYKNVPFYAILSTTTSRIVLKDVKIFFFSESVKKKNFFFVEPCNIGFISAAKIF